MLCPAARGEITACVMPRRRVLAIEAALGLKLSLASSLTDVCESFELMSFVASSPPISTRPSVEKGAIIPDVTHLPSACKTWVSAGATRFVPICAILPDRMRISASSMIPSELLVTNLAFEIK